MSQTIVLFPRLEVTAANAMPAWWFMAPPSPTAYVGFGQALALKCLVNAKAGDFIGVGVVLHDYRLRAEKVRGTYSYLPHQLRAASLIDAVDYSAKNKNALSLQPSARCDMTVSVAVVFGEDADIDPTRLEKFMHSARIAGGVVAQSRKYLLEDGQASVRRKLGTGFAVHLRSDLMKPAAGQDSLDALLLATRPDKETRAKNPWVLPATLGYAAVTPIENRIWTREGYPHAFAEPLVGLVQLMPIRQAGIPIWRYQHPSPDVFMVGY